MRQSSNESLNHRFVDEDFTEISRAINDLGQRGNKAAWKFLKEKYPGDLLYRRVTGNNADNDSNAIDDLGSDVPNRSTSEVWQYARDPRVRDEVLRRAKGRCEFCGALAFVKPDGTSYLESHHIIALADDGVVRMSNVIALCPKDHREAHFGERGGEMEREMVLKVRTIVSEHLS